MRVPIDPKKLIEQNREEIDELIDQGAEALEDAESLHISDEDEFKWASEFAREIKRRKSRIDGAFEPIRGPLYEALQNVYSLRSEAKEKYEAAEEAIKEALADYRARQLKAKAEERRKAVAEAYQEKAQRVQEAEERGDEEAVKEIRSKPVRVEDAVSEEDTTEPEHDAIQYRTIWRGVPDLDTYENEEAALRALCKAIGEGDAPVDLVSLNSKQANNLARALKDTLSLPGLKAESETTVAVYE